MNKKYKIALLKECDDLKSCVNLMDAVLGKNYISAKKILSMLKESKFMCLKAISGNQIVGIAIACIMNHDEGIDYLKIKKYNIPEVVKLHDQIAIIKTIAVDEKFQKNGIGSDFIKELEKWFLSKNIHAIFSVAWRYKNNENIGPLILKNGYNSLFIIEKYYEKDSLIEGFSCPVCGDHGCHCSANIYLKMM